MRKDTIGWIAGSTVAVIGSAGGIASFAVLGVGVSATALDFVQIGFFLFTLVSTTAGISAAQAGGYLGSLKGLRRRPQTTDEGPFRFTTWRLLAVTAIVAVVLSLLKLTGEFAVWLGVSLLVCALIAWAVHRPVAWLTNRWLDWRLRKRRAKRAASVTPPASLPAQTS